MTKTNDTHLLNIWLYILLAITILFAMKTCSGCSQVEDNQPTTYYRTYLDGQEVLIPIE